MLSVGRKHNLDGEVIFCRTCLWNGSRTLLQTGLVPIKDSKIHLFAYRCPQCGGFDLGVSGKLLSFTVQHGRENIEEHHPLENSPPNHHNNGNTEKRDSR